MLKNIAIGRKIEILRRGKKCQKLLRTVCFMIILMDQKSRKTVLEKLLILGIGLKRKIG